MKARRRVAVKIALGWQHLSSRDLVSILKVVEKATGEDLIRKQRESDALAEAEAAFLGETHAGPQPAA